MLVVPSALEAVITGDPSQSDLPRGMASGLRDALGLLEGIRGIAICRFDDTDVVRHPLVADIIRAYDARDRARQAVSDAADAARVAARTSGAPGDSGIP